MGANDPHTRQLLKTLIVLSDQAEAEQRLIIATSGFVADLTEGRILRDHHDLDLVVPSTDFMWLQDCLTDHSFTMKPFKHKNPATAYQAAKDDIIIDVGAISISSNEVSDTTDLDGTPFIWPIKPTEFLWQRPINGTPIYFVHPKVIYAFKQQAGRQSPQDLEDIAVLSRYIKE